MEKNNNNNNHKTTNCALKKQQNRIESKSIRTFSFHRSKECLLKK